MHAAPDTDATRHSDAFLVEVDVTVASDATKDSEALLVVRTQGCVCSARMFLPLKAFTMQDEAVSDAAISSLGVAIANLLLQLYVRHVGASWMSHAAADIAVTLNEAMVRVRRTLLAALEQTSCLDANGHALTRMRHAIARADAQ